MNHSNLWKKACKDTHFKGCKTVIQSFILRPYRPEGVKHLSSSASCLSCFQSLGLTLSKRTPATSVLPCFISGHVCPPSSISSLIWSSHLVLSLLLDLFPLDFVWSIFFIHSADMHIRCQYHFKLYFLCNF